MAKSSVYHLPWEVIKRASPEPITFRSENVPRIVKAMIKRKYEEQLETGRNLGKLWVSRKAETPNEVTFQLVPREAALKI